MASKQISFTKNNIKYSFCLEGNILTLEAIDPLHNSWKRTIEGTFPINTGRDLDTADLYQVLEFAALEKDPDFICKFPDQLPTKEGASLALQVKINYKIGKPDEFPVAIDAVSRDKIEKLTESLIAKDLLIQQLLKRVGDLESKMELFPGFPGISDVNFSASSIHNSDHGVRGCRLNTSGVQPANSWCAGPLDQNQWIRVDLGGVKTVFGVRTQGRAGYPQWVTNYAILWSVDGSNVTSLGDFKGNDDSNTIVTHVFNPIQARFITLNPKTWSSHISLRWDVIYK